ncbi:hypothetical protein GGR50DRAFT_359820 [Xylaria sp. CBS 124048]|nr:hypothetical protein GGR50DRAFT_359820 [Xylaria sp. CBS 124048]
MTLKITYLPALLTVLIINTSWSSKFLPVSTSHFCLVINYLQSRYTLPLSDITLTTTKLHVALDTLTHLTRLQHRLYITRRDNRARKDARAGLLRSRYISYIVITAPRHY